MANGPFHVAVAIASGILVGMYIHPIAGWAVALGNLAPDLDEYTYRKWKSSWITHTAVFPAIIATVYHIQPKFFSIYNIVPAFTFGMLTHVFMDFAFYSQHKKEQEVMKSWFGGIPRPLAIAIAVIPHMPFLFFGIL